MKSPDEWVRELSEAGSDHDCACICTRCKSGRETFLLPQDIREIQSDALSGIRDPDAFVKAAKELAEASTNALIVFAAYIAPEDEKHIIATRRKLREALSAIELAAGKGEK